MLTHLPLIQKFWDRGVDIGVGVITSVVVGIIGLCFWRVKLWLDLRADERKQRQQHRIAAELDEPGRKAQQRERHRRLTQQLKEFAIQAEIIGKRKKDRPDPPNAPSLTNEALAQLWETYLEWLKSNDLDHLEGNLTTITVMTQASKMLRGGDLPKEGVIQGAEDMAGLIRKTKLPPLP